MTENLNEKIKSLDQYIHSQFKFLLENAKWLEKPENLEKVQQAIKAYWGDDLTPNLLEEAQKFYRNEADKISAKFKRIVSRIHDHDIANQLELNQILDQCNDAAEIARKLSQLDSANRWSNRIKSDFTIGFGISTALGSIEGLFNLLPALTGPQIFLCSICITAIAIAANEFFIRPLNISGIKRDIHYELQGKTIKQLQEGLQLSQFMKQAIENIFEQSLSPAAPAVVQENNVRYLNNH